MKRIAALLLALSLWAAPALAELDWDSAPEEARTHLVPYIALVNDTLAELNAGVIGQIYEVYPVFASLGMDGVALPEDFSAEFRLTVEMQFVYSADGLYSLTLRCSELERFGNIAAACIHASSPEGIPLETAQRVARSYANAAISDWQAHQADPENTLTNSFEEPVVDLQGEQPRTYFAYYPNQFGDDVPWLQMTLIFPRPGSEGASLFISATPAPDTSDDEYEGYFSQDNYSHFEIFVTPTPEPDSAAME